MSDITFSTLSSIGCKILLKTDSSRVKSFYADVGDRSIPDYGFEDLPSPDCDWELDVFEGDETSINFGSEERRTVFHFSERSLWQNDLEFLLVYLFANLYLAKDLVLSYAVGLRAGNGRGLMLIGGFASGKSATSLKLLQAGAGYLGNDRLLLGKRQGKMMMLGGSAPIRLRPETIKLHFPEYQSLVDGRSKARFVSVAKELRGKQAVPTPINLVARVKVVPVADEFCTCRKLESMEGRFSEIALYPPLSFFYDHSQLVLLSAGSIYQRLSPESVGDRLLALSKDISGQSRCVEIFGNLEWVVSKINSLLEDEK